MLCGCGASRESSRGASPESAALPSGDNGLSSLNGDALGTIVDIATTQYFTAEAVAEEDIETIVMAGVNAPSAMNGQPWHFSVITDASVLEKINEGMSFGGGIAQGFGMGMPEGAGTAPEGGNFPVGGNAPGGFAQPPEGMEMPENFDGAEMPADFAPPSGFGGAPGAGFGGGQSKAGLTDAPLVIVVSCRNGSELDAGLACQNMSAAAQLLGYGSKIISSPTMALNGEKQDEYRELLGIPEDMLAVALLLIGVEDTAVDESADGYTAASERSPVSDVVTYVKA